MKAASHPTNLGWTRNAGGKILSRSESDYNPLPFAVRAELAGYNSRPIPQAGEVIVLVPDELLEKNLRAMRSQSSNLQPKSPRAEVAKIRGGR